MTNWTAFFVLPEQHYLCYVLFHILVWRSPSPRRARSAGWAPRSPCLHHYQLSLNSSDHHLNYPLSCPPDGFFANYNFSVDGQGIMTAEACAWVAGWNTKRAYGCRCGRKIRLRHRWHTHTHWRKHTYKRHTQTWENTHGVVQLHRHSHGDTHRCWCKHTHTNPFPTSCCRKAIYWPSAEVSSSKVNLRTCLMCSPSLFLSLLLSVRLRETHLPCKSKYTSRVGKCIHTTGDLITGAVNWAMRTSSTANDT